MRFVLIVLLLVATSGVLAQTPKAPPEYQVQDIATDLNFPWALVFLPNGDMLITERSGQLILRGKAGKQRTIGDLPDDIYVAGQGGLMDVQLHPNYPQNGWVYLTYAAGHSSANGTRLIRGRIRHGKWVDNQVLFTVSPLKDTPVHYGAKLTFLPDNSLLLTTGDGFDYREDAQRLNNQMGKIIRLNDDGSIPQNNPYIGETEKNLSHAVFSLGHRNPQGILYDNQRQLIFAHEHGPAGGDEINIIQPGNNYGWPVVTNGRDYSGASITPFKNYPGMQLPFVDWTPSIAPSGMVLYRGKMFPQFNGDLLVSALKAREVRWVQIKGNQLGQQQSLFTELNRRIRDIDVHPDGSLYLILDGSDGKILRVYQ